MTNIFGPSDAVLLELVRQHTEALAICDARQNEMDSALEQAEARYPAVPEVLLCRVSDWLSTSDTVGQPYEHADIGRLRRAVATHEVETSPLVSGRFLPRAREILAAWDTRKAEIEAINEAAGLNGLEAAAEQADRALYQLEARIFALRAVTSEGLRAKAKIAAQVLGEPDETYEDVLVRSLLADLLAAPA